MIDEERISTYKCAGKTPREAFEKIWDMMQYHDDCCLKKISDDEWNIRLVVVMPTVQEMQRFEDYGL